MMETPDHSPRPAGISLEELLAGRGLQIAGLLLVLAGTAFFLDLAFTQGWIQPAERILLGLIAGCATCLFGVRALRGKYAFLAEGLTATGAAILYLSLWASVAVFPELHVPFAAAFAAMIGVSGFIAAVATRRRNERLAVCALLGGFVTPALLGDHATNPWTLAGYVFVLDAIVAVLAVRSRFRVVGVLACAGTCVYGVMLRPADTYGWTHLDAYIAASAYFLTFAGTAVLDAIREPQKIAAHLGMMVADVLVYTIALELLFPGPDYEFQLGFALVALAAALIGAARLPLPRAFSSAMCYLGIGAVTLSLPPLLPHERLVDAFSIEAAILVALGRRTADKAIAAGGAVLLALSGVAVVVTAWSALPGIGIFSDATVALAIWLAAATAARYRGLGSFAAETREVRIATSFVVNAVAVIALDRLALDALGGASWPQAIPNGAQLAISLLWGAYAAALLAFGLRREASDLRWQGLALFAITLAKVGFIDLSTLTAEYRVGSCIGLGVAMVVASALYTRALMRQRAAEAQA